MPVSKNIIKEYLSSLDEKETITYNIAKDHLGSSFDLIKCIGFLKWLKNNHNNIYNKLND